MAGLVLLDTQVVVVAALEGLESLPIRVRLLLTDSTNTLLFSAVSIMEIALKSNLGKLEITREELKEVEQGMRLTPIPFHPAHARTLFSLPAYHRDPFDRMLIATALAENVPLVGQDHAFAQYQGLEVIW